MARRTAKKRQDRQDRTRELVVGVSGHRAFTHGEGPVADLVRAELERLARRHAGKPATCITALAEGADRLVARLARKVLGATIHVCLPMPAKAYAMDFATASSRRAFDTALAKAERIVRAPLLSSGRAWRSYSEERNHQYAWGGAYVAGNADVLVAIWDGKPARGTGGTAFVVDWFLRGRTPRRYGMSKWRIKRAGPPPARQLIHINPETLRVRRRRTER